MITIMIMIMVNGAKINKNKQTINQNERFIG